MNGGYPMTPSKLETKKNDWIKDTLRVFGMATMSYVESKISREQREKIFDGCYESISNKFNTAKAEGEVKAGLYAFKVCVEEKAKSKAEGREEERQRILELPVMKMEDVSKLQTSVKIFDAIATNQLREEIIKSLKSKL